MEVIITALDTALDNIALQEKEGPRGIYTHTHNSHALSLSLSLSHTHTHTHIYIQVWGVWEGSRGKGGQETASKVVAVLANVGGVGVCRTCEQGEGGGMVWTRICSRRVWRWDLRRNKVSKVLGIVVLYSEYSGVI